MVGIGRVAPLPCPGRSMRAVLLFVTALLGRKYVAKEAHPERGSTGPAPRSWRIWVVDQTRSLQASTPGPEVGVEQWPEHASSTETSPAAPRAVVRLPHPRAPTHSPELGRSPEPSHPSHGAELRPGGNSPLDSGHDHRPSRNAAGLFGIRMLGSLWRSSLAVGQLALRNRHHPDSSE